MLAGCGGPLSTLAPAGPVAQDIAWLWWVMLGGAFVLLLMVMVLVALAFGPPRQVSERRWTLAMGVWFPLTVLTALLGTGLWVGERILPRGDSAVQVQAHAVQWGWEFTQPGPDGPVITHNLLHIPAGQPVDVLITSADVIHSFWVPQLGGKMDAIPGRVNRLRLQADEPGLLHGLCAEFCGTGHAFMRFDVRVVPAGDWPAALSAEPAPATRGEPSDD
jgi:cytochrome c oxidase subunit II